MNCREFADFLDRYFEGDLLPAERAEFDRHIEVCPACVAYLDGYRKTVISLQMSAAEHVLIASAPGELIQAILAARLVHSSDDRCDSTD